MDDEEGWLAHEALDFHEWKAVEELAYKAPTQFVVSANLSAGATILTRLVAWRIVETGPPSQADRARGHEIGYALSKLGWRLKQRGRYPPKKKGAR
jgi:hypothetical protein|nr:hypothetical protein [Bradyrhizobium sp. CCH5-A9]